MSNNLNWSEVSVGQNQKEATINEQTSFLDAALTEAFALVGDGPFTPTTSEAAHNVAFQADGTQTGTITLNMPATKKLFVVENSASGFAVDVVVGSTTVNVATATAALLYADGTTNGLVSVASGGGGAATVAYLVKLYADGLLTDAEVFLTDVVTTAFTLPSGLSASRGYAATTATAAATIEIHKNGVSQGTVNFAIGSNTATFTFGSNVSFAIGDRLSLVNQGTADTTLADVSVSLEGDV